MRSEDLITLTTIKKRDDVADCLTQLQAYKYMSFIDKIKMNF